MTNPRSCAIVEPMHRRVIGLVVRAVCVLSLAGCGGDDGGAIDAGEDASVAPATPHARLAWRVRCGGGSACAEDAPARLVDHDDGEDGHRVECDLSETGDGNRRFTLSITTPEGAALRVRGASIALGGDRIVGSTCTLEVDEPDDFDLAGGCSSGPPSADRPCQIQRIDVRTSGGERALVAQIRCTAVPARASAGVTRDVGSATAAGAVADLELTGCVGL